MDCFISYSSKDSGIARSVSSLLTTLGISSFMAEVSLAPGDQWTEEIWENLRASGTVVFLASADSCKSAFVQQELGGAQYASKKIIPVVWDMPPADLPGWLNRTHALDIGGADQFAAADKLAAALASAKQGKWDVQKVILAIVAVAVLAAIVAAARNGQAAAAQDPLACPNCSGSGRVFKMSPIPVDFRTAEAATHECTKCSYKADLGAV